MQFGFTNHQKGTIKQSACSTPKAMKSTTEEVTKRSLRCLILNKLIFLKKCKWLRIRHSKMQNAPTLNHKDAHSISRQSAPSIIPRDQHNEEGTDSKKATKSKTTKNTPKHSQSLRPQPLRRRQFKIKSNIPKHNGSSPPQ